MPPEALEGHLSYAMTRMRRSEKALRKIREDLIDGVYHGTDALSHDGARDAEEFITNANRAIEMAAWSLGIGQGVLENVKENIS